MHETPTQVAGFSARILCRSETFFKSFKNYNNAVDPTPQAILKFLNLSI